MKVSYSKYEATAGENIGAFKAVYISAANTVMLARADSENTLPVVGISEHSANVGEPVMIYTNDSLSGFSGLIPGSDYYLSQDTFGELTTSNPLSGIVVRVGVAINSTELDIHILRVPLGADNKLRGVNVANIIPEDDQKFLKYNLGPPEKFVLDDVVIPAELNTVSGSLQTQINTKSDSGHGHTESDISDLQNYITTVSGGDHTELINVGTNTHGQIDGHISSAANPHSVTADQVGNTTAQWNADKAQGIDFPTPTVGDDELFLSYDHTSGQYTLVSGTAGPQGDQGLPGVSGTIGSQGPQGPQGIQGPSGVGTTIDIYDGGTAVSGTPFEAVNFTGATISGSSTISGGVDVNVCFLFGSEFNYVESDDENTTSSEYWQQKLRLSTGIIPAGDYIVEWAYDFRSASTKEVLVQVDLDEGTIIGSSSSESDKYISNSSFKKFTSTGSSHTVDIDYKRGDLNTTCYIRNTRLTIWRIS